MSIEKLITDLTAGNDRQRRAASYKLLKLQDPVTVPYLIAAFQDKDHSVHRNIVAALRAIGTKEAVEFLESNGIEASGDSEKTASAVANVRTKGCLLSWLAVFLTLIIGFILVYALFPNEDPTAEFSDADKIRAFIVMAAGFVSYYFVRKFHNDKAAKIERTQQIKKISSGPRAQKIMESIQAPTGTVCPECGHVNKQPRSKCEQCKKDYAEMAWGKSGEDLET
jgi:rubrerythrin